MASSESNICNVLRSEWAALIAVIKNVSRFLDNLLRRITTLLDRIVNSFISMYFNMIRDIRDYLGALLAFKAIDQNMVRREYCKWLYKCKPALNLLIDQLPKDMQTWMREDIKVLGLS